MGTTLIDSGYFCLGLYSLALILVGTPMNLLCFYIFKRLIPNRLNATIVVFSYLALIELLVPFTWNLNYVIRELILKRRPSPSIKNLEQHSLFVCKLISYGAYFTLQCAAWLKTFATFARCVSLHHDWSIRKYLSKSRIIHRITWSTIVFIALINLPILIINGRREIALDDSNQTFVKIKCYQSRFFRFWEIAHLLLYNFVPFTLMILCNISIIRHVRQSRLRTQGSKLRSSTAMKRSSTMTSSNSFTNKRSPSSGGARLTQTLVFVTVFFIIFTSPSAIFYIFLGNIVKSHRNLITMALSNLATTSHVSSFLIYWMTSTDFRDAAIGLLCCRPSVLRRPVNDDKQQDKGFSLRRSLSPTLACPTETQRTLTRLLSTQSTE